MNILALETSTASCSVALSISGKRYERSMVAPREHTNLLLPMVQSLLNEAQIELNRINTVAVSLGPGSFVGTRLGVSVAQSLAYAANARVFGYSTLMVLAQSALKEAPQSPLLAVIDAQLGGVYWSQFDIKAGLEAIEENQISTIEESIDMIEAQGTKVIYSPDTTPGIERLKNDAGVLVQNIYPDALALLDCCERDISLDKKGSNPLAIEPIYLRHQVAASVG